MAAGEFTNVAILAVRDNWRAAVRLSDGLEERAPNLTVARWNVDRGLDKIDVAVVLWTPAAAKGEGAWPGQGLDHLLAEHRVVVAADLAAPLPPPSLATEHLVAFNSLGEETVHALLGAVNFVASVPRRFSPTIQGLRAALGPGLPRSPADIIEAMQRRHPEYAAGRFGQLTIDGGAGSPSPVDDWLVLASRRWPDADVVHGRMLLVTMSEESVMAREILSPVIDELYRELGTEELPAPPPQRQEPAAAAAAGREEVRWRSDEPTVDDRLQRRPVANFVAAQLEQLQDEREGRTFLILLDGPWGAGKSTLMGFVQEAIPDDWLVVRFDAWRQSRAGPPWLLLLHALRGALRTGPHRRRTLWFSERWRLLKGGYGLALAFLLSVVVVMGAGLLLLGDEVSLAKVGDLIGIVTGIVGFVALMWTGGRAFQRVFALDTRRGSHAFEMHQPDPMETLAAHFTWLVEKAERPILVLIDDVDRCDEKYVVELLDSVQKLVRETPARTEARREDSIFFLVASDGRWIRDSYELAHAGFAGTVGEAGRPLGSLFLDKLFQLRVPVPVMGESLQRSFLSHLLDDDPAVSEAPQLDPDPALVAQIQGAVGDEVVGVLSRAAPAERAKAAGSAIKQLLQPESQQQTEHALLKFAPLLDANPRSMKRFTMAFNTLRTVSLAEGNAVPLGMLALWTIVTLRWPLLAEYLATDPNAVLLFRTPEDAQPFWVPAPVRTLIADPPQILCDVINHKDGPLDVGNIRRCVGLDLADPEA